MSLSVPLPIPISATIASDFSPIDLARQHQVTDEVNRYLAIAESLYEQSIPTIPVLFDLKGKTAGMYRVKTSRPISKARKNKNILSSIMSDVLALGATSERQIRFNPWLFTKYPEDSWSNTIPHEAAHYIADCLYGISRIRPHGNEWCKVMRDLGAEPIVRANYDLEGIPTRQIKRYPYQCSCRTVDLTAYRHKKIQAGRQRYRCRDCSAELSPIVS
jgi:SprT protein